MTVHLLDTHPGRHRAQPSRPHPLRALLDAIDLLARWWNWPPVQAHYDRRFKRDSRKALAAEMALQASTPGDELGAPDEDGLNRYRTEPLPPESYPYPPTMYPRADGDGLIVLGPDGCIQIRRPEWTRTPETSCDMQALPVVPRYLDAMPGGTE